MQKKKVVATNGPEIRNWNDLRQAFLAICPGTETRFDEASQLGFTRSPYEGIDPQELAKIKTPHSDRNLTNTIHLMAKKFVELDGDPTAQRLALAYLAAYQRIPVPLIEIDSIPTPLTKEAVLSVLVDRATQRIYNMLDLNQEPTDIPAPFATRITPLSPEGGNSTYLTARGKQKIVQWQSFL